MKQQYFTAAYQHPTIKLMSPFQIRELLYLST